MTLEVFYLIIYRVDEEPSMTIRTLGETEQLVEELAEFKIEWIDNTDDIDSRWWYDRLEDWPEKTGVIIKLLPMKVTPVSVVTKYKLESAYEDHSY